MAENKKKKKAKGAAAYILICVIIGIFAGAFMARYSDKLEDAGISGLPADFIIIALFLVSYFIETMIHEAGHMVMGMLTGYEFLSFRVGSFTIMKENGRLVRKKFSIPGSAGQCLLSPKETDSPEDLPFFWYNFGGVFFNLLTGGAALIPAILSDNIYIVAVSVIFAAAAFMMALFNGVPINNMIPNDGYNIVQMIKNPAARTAVYKSFSANARMYRGERPENMPELCIADAEERKTCLGTGLLLTEATLYMYRHQFDRAEELFRSVAEDESAVRLYRMEAKCELLFCLLMLGAEQEKITALCDYELEKYIRLTGKTMICRKRLMYAWYLLLEKSEEKAQAEYEAALKMEKTYPAKGEYLSEMDMINYVKSGNIA